MLLKILIWKLITTEERGLDSNVAAVKDTNLKANHNISHGTQTHRYAVKDTNLKANHNVRCVLLLLCIAVKDTNLKANHNFNKLLNSVVFAVKDTNLKANHNCTKVLCHSLSLLKILIWKLITTKKLKSIHTPVPEDFLIIITHVRDEAYRYLKRGMFFMLPL